MKKFPSSSNQRDKLIWEKNNFKSGQKEWVTKDPAIEKPKPVVNVEVNVNKQPSPSKEKEKEEKVIVESPLKENEQEPSPIIVNVDENEESSTLSSKEVMELPTKKVKKTKDDKKEAHMLSLYVCLVLRRTVNKTFKLAN